ncbi:MAG: aminoacetone oxidase family FAD-binding enzyme, partial [Lachnospiraceae bacterium]|nr:aminoacetone oxidase family FAD-binding enzyme [Lachnospiraceae bacterium]
QGKKSVYEEFGELLFTHFGISGPIVLSASSFLAKYLSNEEVIFKIDLKPALSFGQLDDRILREFEKNINRDFKNSLDALLPKKMIPVMIAYCGIDPNKKINVISKEERKNLVKSLKEFTMTVVSLRGYNEAIITQGGIDVKEINPATMESKRIQHLFLAGELLDVDALTGGFNLQIAWSTGHLAGESVY